MRGSDRLTIRNRCGREKVDVRYRPLIAAAVLAYLEAFAGRVVDIRLLGSVGRGEATPGESDIDFVAVVEGELSETDIQRLEVRAGAMSRVHSEVSRVELEVESAGRMASFRRFVLASDSFSVYGTDRLTMRTQSVARDELIGWVTPDAAVLIRDYRSEIEALRDGIDDESLRFYGRIVGKDLLKCLRAEILRRGGGYEANIGQIHDQILALAPEHGELAAGLYRLYRNTLPDRSRLLVVLDRAERALLPSRCDTVGPRPLMPKAEGFGMRHVTRLTPAKNWRIPPRGR